MNKDSIFPTGFAVGFTHKGSPIGENLVFIEALKAGKLPMTPSQARKIAYTLNLFADFQEQKPDTRLDKAGSPIRIKDPKITELEERMLNHTVDENGNAVVVLTAAELQYLIDKTK